MATKLNINEILSAIVPFFLVVDESLTVHSCGPSLKKIWPHAAKDGTLLKLRNGQRIVELSLTSLVGRKLLVQAANSKETLSMMLIPFGDLFLLCGTLYAPDANGFWELGLTEADFALFDPIPEVAYMARSRDQLQQAHNKDKEKLRWANRQLGTEFVVSEALKDSPSFSIAAEGVAHCLHEALAIPRVEMWYSSKADGKRELKHVCGDVIEADQVYSFVVDLDLPDRLRGRIVCKSTSKEDLERVESTVHHVGSRLESFAFDRARRTKRS